MKKRIFITGTMAALAFATLFTACKDDDDNDTNVGFNANTNFAAVGTVNGQSLNTDDGYVTTGWESETSILNGATVAFTSTVRPSVSVDRPSVKVILGNLRYPDNDFDDKADFYDYFRTGAGQFTYGMEIDDENTNRKVDIVFVDANGDTWRSDWGSEAQPSSNFQITDTLHSNKPNGYVLKYRAKFNCKLYNENGDAIDANITDFVGQVETYE